MDKSAYEDDPIKRFIWDKITFIFPENCFEELIIRFNIFHGKSPKKNFFYKAENDLYFSEKCPKLVLSRVLGLGIVLGSVLGKKANFPLKVTFAFIARFSESPANY